MSNHSFDKNKFKLSAVILITVISAITSAIFAMLFIRSSEVGYLLKYGKVIEIVIDAILCLIMVLTVIFACLKKEFLYKIGLLCLIFLLICTCGLYALNKSGFLDKIDSVEDLRNYIASYGTLSAVLFLVMQILQVVVLPVPGVVAIGAGVLLFGPFWGAVLSFIGIMLGSLIAFGIGRYLGYKVVCWLVGKENLEKGLALAKGKDKVVLSFMFLFPFFPDDVLCFVSGLSSMSGKFFIIMITVARLISTFTTAYSVNGSLIPYNTWWGIVIWAVLIVGTLWLVKVVYTHSGKIEKFFSKSKK